jgi:hypothetical protein
LLDKDAFDSDTTSVALLSPRWLRRLSDTTDHGGVAVSSTESGPYAGDRQRPRLGQTASRSSVGEGETREELGHERFELSGRVSRRLHGQPIAESVVDGVRCQTGLVATNEGP